MHRCRSGIRGPTRPDKANDRAGNAAVRETDRGGSGTNQPSRVSRYVRLAPATSVGGRAADVKVGARHDDRVDQSSGQETGVAGNRAGLSVRSIAVSTRYAESGTDSDER